MHTLLIGFGFGMFLLFGWDSGDWTRSKAREDRADRTLTTNSGETPVKTMDGGAGIPPRP